MLIGQPDPLAVRVSKRGAEGVHPDHVRTPPLSFRTGVRRGFEFDFRPQLSCEVHYATISLIGSSQHVSRGGGRFWSPLTAPFISVCEKPSHTLRLMVKLNLFSSIKSKPKILIQDMVYAYM
jgi:hypothetical protein